MTRSLAQTSAQIVVLLLVAVLSPVAGLGSVAPPRDIVTRDDGLPDLPGPRHIVTKVLYLRDDGTSPADNDEVLNTTAPAGASVPDFDLDGNVGLTLPRDAARMFVATNLTGAFNISGATAVDVYWACDQARPMTIDVRLVDGGNGSVLLNGTDTNGGANCPVQPAWRLYTLSGSVTATVAAGSWLQVNVTRVDAGGGAARRMYLAADATAQPAQVRLPTDSHVVVDTVATTDTSGAPKGSFVPGETVRVRARVSDPLNATNIAGARVTIRDASATIVANNQPMVLAATDVAVPPAWSDFTFDHPLPGGASSGSYSVDVTGDEIDGAVATRGGSFLVSAPNAPPVILPIAPQGGPEDSGPIEVNLRPFESDPEDGTASATFLTWRVKSGYNTTLVPSVSDIGNDSFSFIISANSFGATTIDVDLTDSGGKTVNGSFLLTITPVNDGPVIAPAFPDLEVPEDGPAQSIKLSDHQADIDSSTALLIWTVRTGGLPAAIDRSVINRVGLVTYLNITLQPNGSGASRYTVRLSDGLASADASFWLNVTPVNDLPVWRPIPRSTVRRGDPLQDLVDLPPLASDLETARAALTFQLVSQTNASKIQVQVDAGNKVDVVSVVDGFEGTTEVTLEVRDADNGTAQAVLVIDASFPLPPPPPGISATVTPIAPANGSEVAGPRVTLRWSLATNATGVMLAVHLGTDAGEVAARLPATFLVQLDGNATEYLTPAMETNRTYYWIVLPTLGNLTGSNDGGIWGFHIDPLASSYGVGIAAAPLSIQLAPRATGPVVLTVTNLGNRPQRVGLTATSSSPDVVASLEFPATALLPAGTAGQGIGLELRVLKGAKPGTTVTITVTATSQNDTNERASVSISVEIVKRTGSPPPGTSPAVIGGAVCVSLLVVGLLGILLVASLKRRPAWRHEGWVAPIALAERAWDSSLGRAIALGPSAATEPHPTAVTAGAATPAGPPATWGESTAAPGPPAAWGESTAAPGAPAAKQTPAPAPPKMESGEPKKAASATNAQDHPILEPLVDDGAAVAAVPMAVAIPVPSQPGVGPTKCPGCGEVVEADWEFCPDCDKRLRDERPTDAAVPTAVPATVPADASGQPPRPGGGDAQGTSAPRQ